MVETTNGDPGGARVLAMAAETRSWIRLSAFGLVAVAAFLAFVGAGFRSLVRPPAMLDAWLGAMLLVLAYWVATAAVFARRRPSDAEVMRLWTRLGRGGQAALNLGLGVSPWILLPNADPALRSLLLMMYLWYVATGIMVSSVAMPIPAAEIVLLLLSPVAFLLRHPSPHSLGTAAFLGVVGGNLLVFNHLVRGSVNRGIDTHLAINRAEAAARIAEASAVAGRDAKTRFIAAASHDLQQPLQAASLFFETAIAPGDEGGRDRAIAGARRAFASTQTLIGQMLDFLRLESGAVSPVLQAVALGPLVAEVAMEQAAASTQAGMRLVAMPSRLLVLADPSLLRRAISNLVANAARHADGRHILIGARARGGIATIWVVDDGRGIADADLPRLFGDFSQGSQTVGGGLGGFGLGLASVRRSLTLMGGSAGLDRRWTRGSAFFLRLPLVLAQGRRRPDTLEARRCAAA